MSGHSKWATIKRAKGAADAKRGQVFTKLSREISFAARQGTDTESNFRLRLAVQKARDQNMPKDNIERAIKSGAGGGEGQQLAEFTMEGYGAGGTAIMAQIQSDNRNRTIQEVRNVFVRHGGNLGESGSVSWQFQSKGVLTVEPDKMNPEDMALFAIDAGAEDVKVEKDFIEVQTQPKQLEAVRQALLAQKWHIVSAELSMEPTTMIQLEEKTAIQVLKLMDKLEELDDVQKVYSNADFTDAVLEKYQSGEYSK
jgi:YebC/PmpR family DNA-binding regulatory protein